VAQRRTRLRLRRRRACSLGNEPLVLEGALCLQTGILRKVEVHVEGRHRSLRDVAEMAAQTRMEKSSNASSERRETTPGGIQVKPTRKKARRRGKEKGDGKRIDSSTEKAPCDSSGEKTLPRALKNQNHKERRAHRRRRKGWAIHITRVQKLRKGQPD